MLEEQFLPFFCLLVRLFCIFPDVLLSWHLAAGKSSQRNTHRKISLAMSSFTISLKDSKSTFSGQEFCWKCLFFKNILFYMIIKTLDVEQGQRKCSFRSQHDVQAVHKPQTFLNKSNDSFADQTGWSNKSCVQLHFQI